MGSGYWRVEFIRPEEADGDRCVLLHGQLEETVGPMTIAMAEAWIDRFDIPAPGAAKPAGPDDLSGNDLSGNDLLGKRDPKFKLPKSEPAG
jgi:hypothetical protein